MKHGTQFEAMQKCCRHTECPRGNADTSRQSR